MDNDNYNQVSDEQSQSSKQESSNSGPVFESEPGWGGKFISWLGRLFGNTIVLVLLVLLIIGGLIFFISLRDDDQTVEGEETQQENGSMSDKDDSDKGLDAMPMVTPDISFEGQIYTVTTQKGDGITHLARNVLSSYLTENNKPNLTPEHKIYIEDYLKDRKGSRLLEVGEVLEFTTADIESAIAKAEELVDSELSNLTKYAQRVSDF